MQQWQRIVGLIGIESRGVSGVRDVRDAEEKTSKIFQPPEKVFPIRLSHFSLIIHSSN
jgi:hypothetical protein